MRFITLVSCVLFLTCSPAWSLCGDGLPDPTEQCDDGNLVDGDGCSSLCLFEGCNVSGTWTAVSPEPYTVALREDAGGALTGVAHPVGSPALALPVTGTRTGALLGLRIGSLDFGGAMSDCDAAELLGVATSAPGPLVRVRSSYCGDGTLDAAFEACDDANFTNGDACTVACVAGATCGDATVDPGEGCDDGNDSNRDGCLNGCIPATCGDGWLRSGVEPCDDGNTSGGDGCAADCSLEAETAAGAVTGGVTSITTDTEAGGDGATPGDPIETTLSAPAGTTSGTLSIDEQPPPASNAGWTFFGGVAQLHATDVEPPPTAANPLVVVFRLDASQVPAGQTAGTVGIRKDSVAPPNLPACSGPAGEAVPDPCVAGRERLADGDQRFTIRTSTLSAWNFGAKSCGDRPKLGCWSADPRKAKLKIKHTDRRDLLGWTWKRELLRPTKPFGDPTVTTDYLLCGYNAAGRQFQFAAPAGGTCAGKPCWAQTLSGYKYRDAEGTPDGVVKLAMRSSNRAKVATRALGTLALPGMPIAMPLHAQLRSEDGPCFEATFNIPAANDAVHFRAVAE